MGVCLQSLGFYLGVKTCEFFLCLGVIVCMLYIVSGLFVVLLVLCFTSLASQVFTPTMSQLLLVKSELIEGVSLY